MDVQSMAGTTRPAPRPDLARPPVRSRVAELVLARVVACPAGASLMEIARDLQPVLGSAGSRHAIEPEIEALARDGLVIAGRQIAATEAGRAAAAALIPAETLGAGWPAVRDGALVARALGLESAPRTRRKVLDKVDGLRAAIVASVYGIESRGRPSPQRLRAALAVKALERAFGNRISRDLGAGEGLSAKAGRLLAAQFAQKHKDYGTDSRLIATLAAEAVSVRKGDLAALRLGVLRRHFAAPPAARPAPPPLPHAPAAQASVAAPAVPAVVPSTPRPDLKEFAAEALAAARTCAEGWAGNLKAFISLTLKALRARRPGWGLSDVELKAMLAEAHRTGLLVLATADLKERATLGEVQASALSFRNAVFHYVRIDA